MTSDPFATMMACERQLSDFVGFIAQGQALRLTVGPFEPTESERFMYREYRRQFELAQADYRQWLEWHRKDVCP